MQLNFNNICRFICSFIAGKQPWRDTVRQIDRQADRFAFVYSMLFDNFALIQSSKLEIAKAQNVKYKAKDHKSLPCAQQQQQQQRAGQTKYTENSFGRVII